MITVGEVLARRKFKTEERNGNTRYQPGQYKATRLTKSDMLVTYVDKAGYVILLPVGKTDDGGWVHRGHFIKASHDNGEIERKRRVGGLAEDVMRAIQEVDK